MTKHILNLKVGDIAPDFTVQHNDNMFALSELRGKFVALYFYPKDDTPGCTVEACDFNDLKDEFDKLGAVVLGVSKDSSSSHNKFKNKYNLKFDLIADVSTDICKAYGVLVEKSMFGKKYMGISRSTFLINQRGVIIHVWPQVSVSGHVQDVLRVLKLYIKETDKLRH